MRAFLEKIQNEWLDDFVYASKQPLINLGIDVIPFDGTRLDFHFGETFNYDIKNDICIGSVEATSRFFKACGIETPKYIGYPAELRDFLYRKITKLKFSQIGDGNYPYFIKPAEDIKLFTGTLVDSKKQFDLLKVFYPQITDDTLMYISEPIDIKSEFRCFVYNGEIKGIQYYKGDCLFLPDVKTIKEMVKTYENPPVAYTIDVGVSYIPKYGNFETILIEINDFWAIGSYGFDSELYVKMIIDRTREIAGLPTRKEINEGLKY